MFVKTTNPQRYTHPQNTHVCLCGTKEEAEPDSYWRLKDRFNDCRVELFQQLLWKVKLPEVLLLALFQNGLKYDCPISGHEKLWCPGIWLTPLQSQSCSWWWVGGEWGESGGGGGSPEVHDHLHSFERFKLQVVKTAPDSQLLNLLSVSRLIIVLNEADQCGIVCKLQELDRGVFGCAVVGVKGEGQWGENTALWSSSADRMGDGCVFSQPH